MSARAKLGIRLTSGALIAAALALDPTFRAVVVGVGGAIVFVALAAIPSLIVAAALRWLVFGKPPA